MKRVAFVTTVLITFVVAVVGTASAFNEADFQKLKTTGSCVDCDLSGVLLIHWNLSGANLSGANLSGANLSDAYLAGANLSGANLSNAILAGASLAHTNLVRAKLPGASLFFVSLDDATWTDRSECERGSVGSCKR
jgi:uncharacterized protein YjbI with pentapeptide repeats